MIIKHVVDSIRNCYMIDQIAEITAIPGVYYNWSVPVGFYKLTTWRNSSIQHNYYIKEYYPYNGRNGLISDIEGIVFLFKQE